MLFILYLCLIILCGKLANMRGYPWHWWIIISGIVTPFIAGTILVCLPNHRKVV